MIFFLGVLGFLGFECARLYQKIRSGESVEKVYDRVEIIIVIFMASFAGLMAFILSDGVKSAVFIGLSTPTLIQSITNKKNILQFDSETKNSIGIDDLDISNKPTVLNGIAGRIIRYLH